MRKYNPQKIESKWQKIWAKNPKLSVADEKSKKPKFYCLDMFPYPSGDGLHVGHVESYTASDIYSRYQRMIGKNVLHPIGWDAFGLPAENFAIKTGVHPDKSTHQNIKNFTKQINSLGFSYDWSREIDTSSPEYYKWTQWFFLFLYKNGLAYRKKAKVNWCESCQTVLANEQAEGGTCERCKNEVVQKDLEQWFFKITDFAEDLISDLDKIDWPESTKTAQKNWIGKSEGAIIKFPLSPCHPEISTSSRIRRIPSINGTRDSSVPTRMSELQNDKLFIEVFTTRLDTIFGCTYCVVAPENKLIENLKDQISNYKEVEKYINKAKKKTDLQRMELQKEKTGVEIKGLKVVNPFTNEAVPIFVADYVLSTYGTGAVMAVPAHDERDFEFAKKYKLKIKEVIKSSDKESSIKNEPYIIDGVLVNSGKYSKSDSEKAREEMAKWLEKNKLGKKTTTYKLRDWLISRQRYWGAPIPMIHCEKCGWQMVPEKDLPVLLPKVKDYRPKGTSPLGTNASFVNTICPKCQGTAKRELDTMDTFVCSSWYFFRFADPKNKKEFASKNEIKKWLPVDLYIGGAEHVVLHLLYSRFFTKALHKYKYINFNEPFVKLRHQGMIVAEDGRKMSKSLGNVINPDEIVKLYGADVLRLFEMFMGPLEDSKAWNTKSIVGLKRFLERAWRLSAKLKTQSSKPQLKTQNLERLLNKTIKKVTEDIENLHFNTAISAMMILINEMEKENIIQITNYKLLITLLSPFAPHIAEELWSQMGHKTSIFLEKWPKYDPKLVVEKEVNIVIQINGKVRDQIKISAEASENDIKKMAFESEKIKKYIPNVDNIRKIIFVPGRLINFVV
jgi:leucyl-tRNA synthetase